MVDLILGDLTIASDDVHDNEPIPKRFTTDGENEPPELHWGGVPDQAAELALVLHDPDAPLVDGFTHWVVYGIDPHSAGIGPNGSMAEPGGPAVVGRNDAGQAAYTGPAPPPSHGTHHYYFHLYALDRPIEADEPLSRDELLERMRGHVLEQARLVGTYQR